MVDNAFSARIKGLLTVVDRTTDELTSGLITRIREDAKELSQEQLIQFAREFCVFAKPVATHALRPVIQIELTLMNHIELWRFAHYGNSCPLEEMICEELKSRIDLEDEIILKIADCFTTDEARNVFDRWMRCEE